MIMGFDTYESSKEGGKNVLMYENEYEDFNTGLQCIYIVPMYNKFMKKDFPEGFRNIPDRRKIFLRDLGIYRIELSYTD